MTKTRVIINPFEWHSYFAILPVLVEESIVDLTPEEEFALYIKDVTADNKNGTATLKGNVKRLTEKFAFLQTVERKLHTNMTGTRVWMYRLKESQ